MADPAMPTRGDLGGSPPLASIAVIGGSGFYEFLEDAEQVKVDTPFGAPSDPVTVGEVSGRRVAFLPRHGRDHRFPPHKIPYRANMWALRSVGVRRVLAPTAVGSLTASYGPGTLIVPDQLVDRTRTREATYFDEGACHVPFADPYCPSVRPVAIATARDQGWVPASSGTLVVIEGPRFSSRAESQWFAAQGWTLVGMTGYPEAVLARELAMCYTPLALVTDLDAGVEEGEGVTQAEVFEVFAANIKRLRDLVATIIAALPEDREDDLCAHALDGITLPFDLPSALRPLRLACSALPCARTIQHSPRCAAVSSRRSGRLGRRPTCTIRPFAMSLDECHVPRSVLSQLVLRRRAGPCSIELRLAMFSSRLSAWRTAGGPVGSGRD